MTHRSGFVCILGRPNAGKSSVFNALIQRDRAIVTAQPGTTRDTVSLRLSVSGKSFAATNNVPGFNHAVTYDAATGVLLLGSPAIFTADNVDKYNF